MGVDGEVMLEGRRMMSSDFSISELGKTRGRGERRETIMGEASQSVSQFVASTRVEETYEDVHATSSLRTGTH